MKEKTVTPQILELIRTILKSHNKNADDYLAGIKEAEDYLRDHVEKPGLRSYVNEAISSSNTESGERLMIHDFYDEANRAETYESKASTLAGEVS